MCVCKKLHDINSLKYLYNLRSARVSDWHESRVSDWHESGRCWGAVQIRNPWLSKICNNTCTLYAPFGVQLQLLVFIPNIFVNIWQYICCLHVLCMLCRNKWSKKKKKQFHMTQNFDMILIDWILVSKSISWIEKFVFFLSTFMAKLLLRVELRYFMKLTYQFYENFINFW